VVAPSLIPRKPGKRVKTNRLDALSLAKQLRAGELTAVWVPDDRHEAVRELTRARGAAVLELRAKCQQVSSMLLRLGRHYPGKTTWGKAHMAWLAGQKQEHLEQRIALEERLVAVRQAKERIERLEQAIREAVPTWSLAVLVTALMALRGVDFIAATTLLAEIGDLSRFRTPRELMAWLGLVPSEFSTGEDTRRGPIDYQACPRALDPGGGQPAGAADPDRMRLELPASATGRRRQAFQGRRRAAGGARHCLEGAGAADRAVSVALPRRQAGRGRHHRGGARVGRLHLGHCVCARHQCRGGRCCCEGKRCRQRVRWHSLGRRAVRHIVT
jgi:hypothetical protein